MKKKKILVVDDELDMRTFITTLLETSGEQTGGHHPGCDDASRGWHPDVSGIEN